MIEVVTAATTSAVTLAEAKAHLRVLHEDDDDLITAQLAAACDTIERATRVALQPQTLRCSLKDWPQADRRLWVPRPPMVSVTHVKYMDADNVERTVSSGNYFTLLNTGSVVFLADFSWPSLADRPDAVRVTYVAGVATIPTSLKQCILLQLQQGYDGQDERRQRAIDALIEQHKVRHPQTLWAAAK